MSHHLKLALAASVCLFAQFLPASAHNYNEQGICTDADCTDPFQPPTLEEGWACSTRRMPPEPFSP